jgi:hypothetical protein
MLNNVIFKETEGWMRDKEPLLSSDLADSSIAAQKLKDTFYMDAAWSRTEN